MKTTNFTQRLKIILGMIFCSSLASAQGTQQEITYESTYGNGQSFGYLEYLPVDYASSEEKFPLLISLHGLGWRAEGNGIEFSKLKNGNHVAKRIEAGEHFPAIVISPQQPKNVNGRYSGRGSWDANIIDEVLERVKGLRRVDTNRIYITGTSMGGGGVWLYLKKHGDKIAAAAPICPTKTISSGDTKSSNIKDTPMWTFHNYGDNVVNRSSTEQVMGWIDASNPDNTNRKTIYAWSGHNSWDATYSGQGRDTTSNSSNQVEYGANTNKPNVFEWMFAHNLRAAYPIRASVADDTPNQLFVEFNQPVTQANISGFRLEGTEASLVALSSELGAAKLRFTLSGDVQVGEVLSLFYDDQAGVLANGAGINTTAFNDFEVENTVGFLKLKADDIAIDFSDGSQICPAGWNHQPNHQQGALLNQPKSVSGTSSNLVIRTLTSWPGAFDDGTTTGNGSGVFPDEVMKTFWTVGSDTEQLSVEGLATNQTYSFHFFSSRSSSSSTRLTEYSIQGKTAVLDAKMNASRLVKLTDISPDAAGKVIISMRRPEGSQYGYINALVIRTQGESATPPVNATPVVSTCADTLIQLPADQVVLKGQAEDADGTIVSYQWMQTSGPNQAQLSGDDAPEVMVSGVTTGEYAFRFSATDNQGATSAQEVSVTVEPQNIAPVADAGDNQNILLPLDSVLLAGTATDADGTIVSYQWTQLAGPSIATVRTPTTESTRINDLEVGQYTFALAVSDNEGLTSSSEVHVDVRQNQAPSVSAGDKITLNLPENSTTLNTQAEDDDGEIVSVSWAQKSGPAAAELVNAESLSPSVSKLVAGSYLFEVTVRDNHGEAASDSVTIEVIPEPITTPPSPSPSPTPSPGPAPSPTEENYISGLVYSYYEGTWSELPNFASLEPAKSGTVENFTLSPREQDVSFAFTFDGFIDITTEGTYTFCTASDDGSKLYIDGRAVVDNDGLHGKEEKSGQVHLSVGKHPIRVTFFERWGSEILEVKYEGPGISKQFIPASVLSQSDEVANARLLQGTKMESGGSLEGKLAGGDVVVRTYPNPVRHILHVAFGEERSVKAMFVDNFGNTINTLEVTGQHLRIDLRDLRIKDGIFMLTIIDTETNQVLCSRKMIRR